MYILSQILKIFMQKIKFKNKIEALLANHNNFDLMQKKQLNYLISNLKNIIYMSKI